MRIRWLDPKRARRGWVALLVAALLGAYITQAHTFAISLNTGLELRDADWVARIANVPYSWAAIEDTDTYARASESAPEIRVWLDTWMRQHTGIRWTPTRYARWFGATAVFSGRDEDVVASVETGGMTPYLHEFLRWRAGANQPDGMTEYDGYYIAWSGGHMLIGTSPEIVAELRDNGEFISKLSLETVMFDRRDTGRTVYFGFDREISTTVYLSNPEAQPAGTSGYFQLEWPEQPIISAATHDFRLWEPLFPENWPEFVLREELTRTWQDFETLLPDQWREGADTTQFALFDVDTTETIPIPSAAVYARSETPLEPLAAPVSAIPYEWSGNTGWMTPWQGEGAHLFVVANNRTRVFTNQEATMAAIMARERAGRVVSDDVLIAVDAPRLSKILIDLARKAAKNELWPEKNYDDVEHDIVPWLRAFGALGEIRLEGRYENGPLVLNGGTQAPKDAAE